jgi:hypothetical protein
MITVSLRRARPYGGKHCRNGDDWIHQLFRGVDRRRIATLRPRQQSVQSSQTSARHERPYQPNVLGFRSAMRTVSRRSPDVSRPDVFRVRNGKLVEHWDGAVINPPATAGGRGQ